MKHLYILIFVVLSQASFAQSGQPPIAGARGWGLAGCGLGFRDVHAAMSNQAGLAWIDGTEVATGGDLRYGMGGVRSGFLAAAMPLQQGGVGLSVSHFGNTFLNETRLGLGYGRRFAKNFSVGVQMDYLRMVIPDNGNVNILTFEAGLQAKISEKVWTAAHVYSPFQVKLGETEPVPTLLRFGVNWQVEKQLLTMGEVIKDIDYKLGLRMAVEYLPVDALVIRAGVQTEPAKMSVGIGYQIFNGLRIDAAADYHLTLGATPALSIHWYQKKKKK